MKKIIRLCMLIVLLSCTRYNEDSTSYVYFWKVYNYKYDVTKNRDGLVVDSMIYDTVVVQNKSKIINTKNTILNKIHSLDISKYDYFILNKIDTSYIFYEFSNKVFYRNEEYIYKCYSLEFVEKINNEKIVREMKIYLNSKLGINIIKYREHYPQLYILQKIFKIQGKDMKVINDISDLPLEIINPPLPK